MQRAYDEAIVPYELPPPGDPDKYPPSWEIERISQRMAVEHLPEDGSQGATFTTTWEYSKGDPCAVTIWFPSAEKADERIAWVIARSLLYDVLATGNAGIGDIRFARESPYHDSPIIITIDDPEDPMQKVRLRVPEVGIRLLLFYSERLVSPLQEPGIVEAAIQQEVWRNLPTWRREWRPKPQ